MRPAQHRPASRPGGVLVFTYVDAGVLDGSVSFSRPGGGGQRSPGRRTVDFRPVQAHVVVSWATVASCSSPTFRPSKRVSAGSPPWPPRARLRPLPRRRGPDCLMPKVTDEHRDRRRRQILDAAWPASTAGAATPPLRMKSCRSRAQCRCHLPVLRQQGRHHRGGAAERHAHERSLLADALAGDDLGHRCGRSSSATSYGWATPTNNAGDESNVYVWAESHATIRALLASSPPALPLLPVR